MALPSRAAGGPRSGHCPDRWDLTEGPQCDNAALRDIVTPSGTHSCKAVAMPQVEFPHLHWIKELARVGLQVLGGDPDTVAPSDLPLCRSEGTRRRSTRFCLGLFGADDQIGTVNLLGPDTVLHAASLVRRGATYNLDYELNASRRRYPLPQGPAALRPVPARRAGPRRLRQRLLPPGQLAYRRAPPSPAQRPWLLRQGERRCRRVGLASTRHPACRAQRHRRTRRAARPAEVPRRCGPWTCGRRRPSPRPISTVPLVPRG